MEDNRKSFKFQLNIGFIVFIILFVYLTITIVANLMKDRISVCRVEEGQIVNSASFTGVCIRDEEVINASGNGYINFYVGEGDKVASAGNIYLLSSNPPQNNSTQDSENRTFSASAYSDIRDQITVFSKNYTDSQFSQVYSLSYNLQSLSTETIRQTPPEVRLFKPPGAALSLTVMTGMKIFLWKL